MSDCAKVFVVSAFVISCLAQDLPSYFPRCHLNDTKLSECVKQAFNELRPYVRNGIEGIKLPPLNPLIVQEMLVVQELPTANFSASTYNFILGNLDNYNVKDFQYDPKTKTFKIQIGFEVITIDTLFKADGRFLTVDFHGKGSAHWVLNSINATIIIKGHTTTVNQIDYYKANDVKVDLIINDGKFTSNFDDNDRLSYLITGLFNTNSKEAIPAITPALEGIVRTGILKFVKSLTRSVPFNKLFP